MRRPGHIAALAATLFSWGALADGVSGYVEENFIASHTDNSDATGAVQRLDTRQLVQRYRLSLDRGFSPTLRFTGGGLFERTIGDTSGSGLDRDLAARSWNAWGNLTYAIPTLTLGTGYNRREVFVGGPRGLIFEEYSLLGTWRPEGLPGLFLRLSRPSTFDTTRAFQDLHSIEGLLTLAWQPDRTTDLAYSVAYSNPTDAIRQSETTTWLQTARAAYNDTVLAGRSTVALSANASRRITEIHSRGAGTFVTLRTPVAGYSLVESGTDTRQRDTLVQNVAVINGDLTTSAAVNLGFAPTASGDVSYREVGVQLADAATVVNTLYVWVDRDVSPEVAQAIRFEVWKSDNNLDWTQVDVLAQFSAQFVTLQDRFEITIPATQSRWIKVVAKPLLLSVTTDRRYADVFVTELQLADVEPLPARRRVDANNAGLLSASARTLLLPAYNLAHDISLYLSSQQRPNLPVATVWIILNGLTASRPLGEKLLLSARVARQDADQLRGHESSFLYSASVAATPLPTLSHTLVYSGQVNDTAAGVLTSNSLSLFNQATPYQGIGVVAALSYGVSTNALGQTSRTDSLTLTSTAQPNPRLTLSGSFAHSATITEGAGLARTATVTNRMDGTVTFVPVRALYASITGTRIVQQPRPLTLASGSLSFNPFPGGDLQLGASYTENLDADQSRTRFFGPFLRWNIRRGVVVNLSYTILQIDRHAQGEQNTNTFVANLAIPL